MINKEIREKLAERLETISASDKEKIIFRTRYGLDDGIYRTFEQTGDLFNITGEAVRQTVRKIEDLMGIKVENRSGSFYLTEQTTK